MKKEKTIAEVAYLKYQLQWFSKNKISFDDVVNNVIEYMEENPGCSLKDWELESGYKGSLYVCEEEFLGAEYLDKEFMKKLLTPSEYQEYLKDVA